MAVTSVIYAGYGVWNDTLNRTNEAQGLLTDAYNAGEHSVTWYASNDVWGPDPKPGERKYLFAAWSQAGTISSGVVGEDDDNGFVVPTGA